MRGCFLLREIATRRINLIPAHAGVFLRVIWASEIASPDPRSCGGVSCEQIVQDGLKA